jgi:cytochrome c oxidase assembly factor CtaG
MTPDGRAGGGTGGRRAPGASLLLLVAGAVLVVVSLLPPVSTLARRYIIAETAQFAMLAMVGPALIVLGAPWRPLRLSRWAGRLAAGRDRGPSFRRAAVFPAAFAGLTVLWRLPPVLDALSRFPWLVAAEAVTLLAAGIALWLELVPSPPLLPRLSLPQRAAFGAVGMWSVWIVGYALGFSSRPDAAAYAGGGVAAQEAAVGLVWGVASACFLPVIFATVFAWLAGGDVDDELRRELPGSRAVVRGWDRPPHRRGGS